MDLLARLGEWLDAHDRAQGDPAGHDAVKRNRQVSVAISVGGRRVDLVIGRRSGTADGTSDAPVTAEVTPDRRPEPDDCSWPEPHRQAPAPAFWDALDPTEREALRSLASWRTFAAGARLMEEGEPADHVMVILGGKVEIRLNENGRERVLAIRGVGQLVGEAGALKVSVRSATVVALDLIWALVVGTRDFAAFLTAHPRVRAIVQNQVDQRRSEGPAGYWRDYGQGSSGTGSDYAAATANEPAHGLATGYFAPRPRPLTGENCTVFLSDVVRFGVRTRTDEDRRLIRETLFMATQAALRDVADVHIEDRGDGFLSVAPPAVPTARVMDRLLGELSAAVRRHNSAHRETARFQLRLAVNVGPVVSDAAGVSGETIIVAARLVDAPHFKMAIEGSTASLGVIASPFVYESVIRHDRDPGYTEVPVEVKESETTAWMRLFGPSTPYPLILQPTAREAYLRPLVRIPSRPPMSPRQQSLQPGQSLQQVGLGGGLASPGQRQPAQRSVVVLGPRRLRSPGGHEVPQVRVLVSRLPPARRDAHDDQMPELRIRPRHQVGQPGLLGRFPAGDGQRVALPRVAVPADLQPGLLPLVPAQQHPAGGRVHDQRRGRDMQRQVAPPRVAGGLGQGLHPRQVSRLGFALRPVLSQQHGQRRRCGVRIHSRRC
jgi:hypothetical protein